MTAETHDICSSKFYHAIYFRHIVFEVYQWCGWLFSFGCRYVGMPSATGELLNFKVGVLGSFTLHYVSYYFVSFYLHYLDTYYIIYIMQNVTHRLKRSENVIKVPHVARGLRTVCDKATVCKWLSCEALAYGYRTKHDLRIHVAHEYQQGIYCTCIPSIPMPNEWRVRALVDEI